ncbi:MAG: glycosyl transferase family 1 [Acidobacteria bacterium 13_1_20CM_3_53_8]|nr:MAG: glycosyl transferase family 1 [Acidobacteria bacterium 13_1_20CM_3_53_8]
MRVLHVHSGNLFGGIETFLLTLARHQELCPAMEQNYALCFEGRLSRELESLNAPVSKLGSVRISRPQTVWRGRRALRELLKLERFDIAVCHSAWTQAIFAPVIRKAGIPLVFWLHGAANGRHWLERYARRTPPDFALCNSLFTSGTLRNLYPKVSSEVIYYPIAPPEILDSEIDREETRNKLNTPKDATVVIQVSRMEQWKGHELHLKALSLIKDVPNWVCWQVGGEQRPEERRYFNGLKKSAAELGIADRVRFLGQRTNVTELLAASDIHCQPNAGPEPFGITFIEALYAQLPVVTTAIGGGLEIVDDSCGVLVQPEPYDLAAALRKLIEDKTLRRTLGTTGPHRARTLCDVKTQLERINRILTRVLYPNAE